MTKKYGDNNGQPPAGIPMGRPSLHEWLPRYMAYCADDVMKARDFMQGRHPLGFWLWLFEPEQAHERLTQGKTEGEWTWPFALRMGIHAMKFISMPQNQQFYVIKARKHEPTIWWRGDDFPDFERITVESMRFFKLTLEQKLDYKKSVMKQVETLRHGF